MLKLATLGLVLALLDPQGIVVTRRSGGGGGGDNPGEDWTSYAIAGWLMESTGNETNVVTTGGEACGTDCDLTESGTDGVGRNGTTFIEGTYSRETTVLDDGLLSCDWNPSTGDCEELDMHQEDFSVTYWIYLDAAMTADKIQVGLIDATNNGGYTVGTNQQTIDEWQVLYRTSAGSNRNLRLADTADPDTSQWYHITYVYDDDVSATEHTYYVRSSTDVDLTDTEGETTNRVNTVSASTTTAFTVFGATGSTTGSLKLDEVFVYGDPLSDNASCRICACGWDGAECTDNGSVWTDIGRSATDCSGCLGTVDVSTICVGVADPANCT